MNATYEAALTLISVVEDEFGAVLTSSRQTVLLTVPIRAAHDPVLCRQDMIRAGRAELARRGVPVGSVAFLGARLGDVGEGMPIAAEAAADLQLAAWR